MERKITKELLKDFEKNMLEDEKSKATVEKYLRDLHCFVNYANNREIDKTLVLEYKAALACPYERKFYACRTECIFAFCRLA